MRHACGRPRRRRWTPTPTRCCRSARAPRPACASSSTTPLLLAARRRARRRQLRRPAREGTDVYLRDVLTLIREARRRADGAPTAARVLAHGVLGAVSSFTLRLARRPHRPPRRRACRLRRRVGRARRRRPQLLTLVAVCAPSAAGWSTGVRILGRSSARRSRRVEASAVTAIGPVLGSRRSALLTLLVVVAARAPGLGRRRTGGSSAASSWPGCCCSCGRSRRAYSPRSWARGVRRRPSWRRIAPIWRDIAVANGLPSGRYVLRVVRPTRSTPSPAAATSWSSPPSPSRAPGARAGRCAGPRAEPPPRAAHRGLTIGHWLSLPVVLARIGFCLENVAKAAADSAGHTACHPGPLVAGVLTGCRGCSSRPSRGRRDQEHGQPPSELQADQLVVRMGFGPNLSDALRRVLAWAMGPTGRLAARLAASHPPARTRVARIDAMLRPLSVTCPGPRGRVSPKSRGRRPSAPSSAALTRRRRSILGGRQGLRTLRRSSGATARSRPRRRRSRTPFRTARPTRR